MPQSTGLRVRASLQKDPQLHPETLKMGHAKREGGMCPDNVILEASRSEKASHSRPPQEGKTRMPPAGETPTSHGQTADPSPGQ